MKAKSINGQAIEEIRVALQESMADGFNPTLAIVFQSVKHNIEELCAILEKNNIAIFGATATGEFSDVAFGSDSIVILLFDIDPSFFSIKFSDIDIPEVEEIAARFAKEGLETFSNPAFIVSASNFSTPGESIIKGITEVTGVGATIIGGVASDHDLIDGSRIFTNGKISPQGIIFLILDQNKISVDGYAVSGWKPVGTLKKVTKSEGNRVFTIDNQPALDLLIKYTGIEVNFDDSMDLYNQLGSSYPLQVHKTEGFPIMKPPLMFNKSDHSIICGGIVPEGSKIKFSLPPDFEVIDEVIMNAEDAKNSEIPEADALLVFSCQGRFEAFGPLVEKEIEGLRNIWKVPMAGFFSFGEFGATPGGKSDFHGTTCSWVVLKEK